MSAGIHNFHYHLGHGRLPLVSKFLVSNVCTIFKIEKESLLNMVHWRCFCGAIISPWKFDRFIQKTFFAEKILFKRNNTALRFAYGIFRTHDGWTGEYDVAKNEENNEEDEKENSSRQSKDEISERKRKQKKKNLECFDLNCYRLRI